MRPIDADTVLAEIMDFIDEYSEVDESGLHNPKWCAMEEAKDVILNAPTMDAVPVVHGHWIIYPDVCVCSECNEQSPGIFKYCPNCGAIMDEEAKEAWE